jgi:hypothetical protein
MLNEHDESAFPVEVGQTCDDLRGMSLFDWFAGQALSGLLSDPTIERCSPEGFASSSYDYAEAMMNERKRRYDERK